MRLFLSLTRLYLRSFYNIPDFGQLKRQLVSGSKPAARVVLRGIGLVVLGLILLFNFGVMFITMNSVLYDALAPRGLQSFLLLNSVVTATVLTLVVGFLTALSTYFLNQAEHSLLALPIPPRALLGAKFLAVYSSEALFSLFVLVATLAIYGPREQAPAMFYVWGVLIGLSLPLPVLALTYLVQIPLLSLARFLRNKHTMLVIGGVLGLAFGLGFNIYYQRILGSATNPAWLADTIGSSRLFAVAEGYYAPVRLSWQILADPGSLKSAISMLLLLAVCLAAPLTVIGVLGPAYAATLPGFGDQQLTAMKKTERSSFFGKRFRRGSPFFALVLRELRLMNREPVYLLNGPFIIVLMPVMIGIMLFAQRDAFAGGEQAELLRLLMGDGRGMLLCAFTGAFLGSATSIAATAVSRDAKLLPGIKALPVRAETYMLAKYAHALIFALFGIAVSVGLFAGFFGLGPVEAMSGALAALSLAALFNLLALLLDMVNPRLEWDNPVAALKQNPNSVIVMLAVMTVLGASGALLFQTMPALPLFLLLFGLVPALAVAGLLALLPAAARRCLERLGA